MSFRDRLEEFVSNQSALFKYTVGDKVCQIDLDVSPTIAYDYLLLDDESEYSFSNKELNNISSEEYPDKSDYAIYFEKVKIFCSRRLDSSFFHTPYREHIHINQPNRRMSEVLTKVFGRRMRPEEWPPIMQFALYTNKNGGKAPRIFCAVGNFAVVYVLFYDPYHKISS